MLYGSQSPLRHTSSKKTSARPLRPDRAYLVIVDVQLVGCADACAKLQQASASFSTGLMRGNISGWDGAVWIAGTSDVSVVPRRNNLRTTWQLEADPSEGTAMVAGIGYHELYCNGKRMGAARSKLQPGVTHYERRTYYIRYDLSACLRRGVNVLAVSLGNGWFSSGAPHGMPGATGLPGTRSVPPQLLIRAVYTARTKFLTFWTSILPA